MTVKKLNHNNFEALINPAKMNVIKLWHGRCPMCKSLEPIYEKIAKIYENDFCFFEVDTVLDKYVLSSLLRRGEPGGVPEIYFYRIGKFKEIPWPSTPVESGYSEEYLKTFFDYCKWYGSFV